MFYKGDSIFTEVSIFVELNGKGKESNRISVDVKENIPNNISIQVSDFFDDIDSGVLKRIELISHNPEKSEKELCISEISLTKGEK
jgi:hypothetical protein